MRTDAGIEGFKVLRLSKHEWVKTALILYQLHILNPPTPQPSPRGYPHQQAKTLSLKLWRYPLVPSHAKWVLSEYGTLVYGYHCLPSPWGPIGHPGTGIVEIKVCPYSRMSTRAIISDLYHKPFQWMLRLLMSKAQGRKDFRKTSKPCHVGISVNLNKLTAGNSPKVAFSVSSLVFVS